MCDLKDVFDMQVCALSVWPDWSIFKCLGDNFLLQNSPNNLLYSGYFISISGHTLCDATPNILIIFDADNNSV